MLKPNDSLGFAYADLYPNWTGIDTSQLAVPEEQDLEALHEDATAAEESSTQASTKSIFLTLGVLAAIVVFFGGR